MTTGAGRDNGLHAETYVYLGSVEPPVADDLLAALREEGIAAYVVPAEPSTDPFLRWTVNRIELPTYRVYVDRLGASYAQVLLRRRRRDHEAAAVHPSSAEPVPAEDVDEAWQRIVADFDREPASGERPWPTAEDVERAEAAAPAATSRVSPDRDLADLEVEEDDGEHREEGDDEEHYEPPEPPRLPSGDPVTKVAWVGVGAGAGYLIVGALAGFHMPGWSVLLAVVAFVGGVVAHVIRIRDPRDPGSDDGAVV